ncbi:MAG: hypothetical protein ACRCTZ_08335 [Sarcina sp.]
MKEFTLEFEKLKKECEDFGLNKLILTFSKSVKEASSLVNFDTRIQEVSDKNPIIVEFDLILIDLLIEASKGETDPDEFEEKVNQYFGLKPHEFLLVNRRVYKKNTLAFGCSDEQCSSCLNFITCPRNGKGKIFTVLELQPTYSRLRVRDDEDGVEAHTFGDKASNLFKRKQNQLFEIISSKLFYFGNKSRLRNGGR